MATKCTFGPNEDGKFTIDQVVPEATANKCNRDKCICTSHDDYHIIVGDRLRQARGEEEPSEVPSEPEPEVEEEEEEVIRPVEPEPEPETVEDIDAKSDGFRFRLKPAPLSMEEYDSYHLDDVYIVCEVGTTNALLTLNEFQQWCFGRDPIAECKCDTRMVFKDKVQPQDDSQMGGEFGANIFYALMFASLAVSLIAILCIVCICVCSKAKQLKSDDN